MPDREKLIDLICEAARKLGFKDGLALLLCLWLSRGSKWLISPIVDHLISNGVLVFQFKVDDPVWVIVKGKVWDTRIIGIEYTYNEDGKVAVFYNCGGYYFVPEEIGKTVFTSEFAAKAALGEVI